MKKIAIVSIGYLFFPCEAGPSRFFQIANTFVEAGYQVEAITIDFQHFKKARRETDLILSQGYPFDIKFIHMPSYKKNIDLRRVYSNRKAALGIEAYLKEHIKEYDVVYTSIPANDVAAKVTSVCKKAGVPCVVDIEDLWPEAMRMVVKNETLQKVLFSRFQKDAEIAYANCDAAIGTSEDYTARATKYNHRNIPLETVYVGCNLKEFDAGVAQFKKEISKPSDEFWLTYAGSISTSYDIKNVIEAARLVAAEENEGEKNLHLQILGTGSNKDELEAFVKEEGIKNVHFWGFTPYPKMAAVLDASDLVINSFVKGAPQSIVNKVGDYLASGKPMLNTLENPIFCQLIEKNQVGRNIKAGDAKALAEAICAYLANEELIREDGKRARELAEARFDRATAYREIVALVEKL